MWQAEEKAGDASKVPNHYIPMPQYYTEEDAMVRGGLWLHWSKKRDINEIRVYCHLVVDSGITPIDV